MLPVRGKSRRVDSYMTDPDLWTLMQRVETLRYRAELLNSASVDQPPAVRDFLAHLADLSERDAAELAQEYRVHHERPVAKVMAR